MSPEEISKALDSERKQISHEIHDALLPLIFAAAAAVDQEVRSSPEPSPQLVQASKWLAEAQKAGRNIIDSAHSPELEGCSWEDACRASISNLKLDDSIQIQWQIADTGIELSPTASAACHRIVVESVRNACNHANAAVVKISGVAVRGVFSVTISDDGIGFDPSTVGADHFGIQTMRQRAELLGGTFKIESSPKGTNVIVTLPCDDSQADDPISP